MFLSLRVTSCGEAFSGLPIGLLLTSAQSLLEQGRYVRAVSLFCPDTLPVWPFSRGWPCEFPGIESSCFCNQGRRWQEPCQRNPKGLTAAEPSSTPGQPVLPAFEAITGFTVRLFWDLLSKSEDCLGPDGLCSDFLVRFTEAGLAA